MPCRLSIRNTGKRPGANSAGSVGANQAITWRVTRSGAGNCGSSDLDPRAGRDDRGARLDGAAVGHDAHAAGARLDARARSRLVRISAPACLRQRDERVDRRLGVRGSRRRAAARPHSAPAAGRPESAASIPPPPCTSCGEPVQARRRERAAHQRAVGRADLGNAGDVEELSRRSPLRARARAHRRAAAAARRRDARNRTSRMMRVAPCEEPRSWPGAKRSMPSTRTPRRAS